jgi:GNAT superfamily N-acetyltransferase
VRPVEIRAATVDDLPACHAVWLSTEDDVPPATGAETVLPLHLHELHTGRLLVATIPASTARDEVIGFGATLTRSGTAYVADLFVRPDRQGQGIGGRLLQGLLADHDGPRFTLASTDPGARALYGRFGMVAREEFLYLRAATSSIDWAPLAGGDAVELVDATVDDVAPIDRAVTGRDRRVDLEHARDHLGARLLLAWHDGAITGYTSYAHPIWWNPWHPDAVRIGPVAVLDPATAAPVIAATLRATAALESGWLGPFVPASSPALEPLVAAGFRTVDTDLLMTSEAGLVDPARYHPAVDTA